MRSNNSIQFNVQGRPPRKSGANSFWATDEASRVFDLRKKAYESLQNAKIELPILSKINLQVTIYGPNITNRKNSRTYVGDLDTFVAGVCDAIQAAAKGVKPSPIFENAPDIDPKIAIIKDDSQIVSILAKKILDNTEHYSVTIDFV